MTQDITQEQKLNISRINKLLDELEQMRILFGGDDRFSRACTALFNEEVAAARANVEARWFGAGGDCDGLIWQSAVKGAEKALECLGFTYETFVYELYDRMNSRDVYFSGLTALIPAEAEERGHRAWIHDQKRIADSGC
jgi:hypothetical protein